ncbi:hypothetical protein JAAARDRAFT_33671 [Jaapia argillacea MUCL 33604]|uniref:Uncharacterized protein n=1 Tax=Jaapia argillacea MUCL 33604 TaxID=933084 RepID=A0A067PYL1_9AGAM|nr:hypothetical protein JAAARDRAFT_33671 [Jaapia argillacea MUCL 33604]
MSSDSNISITPSWGKLDHLIFRDGSVGDGVVVPWYRRIVCLLFGWRGRDVWTFRFKIFSQVGRGYIPTTSRRLGDSSLNHRAIRVRVGPVYSSNGNVHASCRRYEVQPKRRSCHGVRQGMIVDSLKSASCLFYLDIRLRGSPTGPASFPNETLQERIQDLANALPSLLAVWLCDDDGKEFWNVRRDAEDSGKAELRKMAGQTCLDNWSFQYYPASFQDHLGARIPNLTTLVEAWSLD